LPIAERPGLAIEGEQKYETAAGLVLERIGEVPAVGQSIDVDEWRIEIADMDGQRIDKLLVGRLPESR